MEVSDRRAYSIHHAIIYFDYGCFIVRSILKLARIAKQVELRHRGK
jgi:hypothetical protein